MERVVLIFLALEFSSEALPTMNKPSASAPAAAAVAPNERPPAAIVIVVELAIVATSNLSPVRALIITSPTVKM